MDKFKPGDRVEKHQRKGTVKRRRPGDGSQVIIGIEEWYEVEWDDGEFSDTAVDARELRRIG